MAFPLDTPGSLTCSRCNTALPASPPPLRSATGQLVCAACAQSLLQQGPGGPVPYAAQAQMQAPAAPAWAAAPQASPGGWGHDPAGYTPPTPRGMNALGLISITLFVASLVASGATAGYAGMLLATTAEKQGVDKKILALQERLAHPKDAQDHADATQEQQKIMVPIIKEIKDDKSLKMYSLGCLGIAAFGVLLAFAGFFKSNSGKISPTVGLILNLLLLGCCGMGLMGVNSPQFDEALMQMQPK